jgi:high-affinity iron transporter
LPSSSRRRAPAEHAHRSVPARPPRGWPADLRSGRTGRGYGDGAPWRLAGQLRTLLGGAEKSLILEGPEQAATLVQRARPVAASLARRLEGQAPDAAATLLDAVERAGRAAAEGSGVDLAAARAEAATAVLAGAYESVSAATAAGDVTSARAWLLVREFRKPTRFSRPGADATLALAALARGATTPAAALVVVRADLLDTYQARLQASLEAADEAVDRGFATRAASEATLSAGYVDILAAAYREQRRPDAAVKLVASARELALAAAAGDRPAYETARAAIDGELARFRAAPLSAQEEQRRAGQFLRFLAIVPVEYGRGIKDGRVMLDFEVQEAITFRDGAAQAFSDLEAALAQRDPTATAGIGDAVDELGAALALAARGEQVTDPARVEELAEGALALADSVFPEAWKDTGAADFDVIRTSLDRVEGAVAASEWGKAEQARLEAYAFFEFGPEQRLRGLAPELFVRVEGLFWYGEGDHAGLAQLLTRKAQPEEVTATRSALDRALADAEEAVGSGPQSTFAVVTNTAIIVFREGLEAVLILAALVAGMAGVQRRLRRPLLLGAAGAVVASVLTFVVAQTVLDSLARYGEKLEAVVSLVAIAVLLVILNWFFHKVYWNDHLAGLHGRKKTILRGAGLTAAAAQLAALAMLGFSSVYREGFETVLFLQAIVLEAGAGRVAQGVALGLAGVGLIAVATIALQRKLPHKRMLELTGVLILAVLVVMVGKTVQACQVVGWLPVNVIGGVRLPYWAGAWFGVFPTWEGLAAQVAAVVLVVGSYVAAERWRTRRRRRILQPAVRPAGPNLEPEPERVESPA